MAESSSFWPLLVSAAIESYQDRDQASINRNTSLQMANLQSGKAYPGQGKLAAELAPYLWENINTGLTPEEKKLYYNQGKTSILQADKSNRGQASKIFASQGLKGGSIANLLASTNASEFTKLNNNIMLADINKKNMRIEDILKFLSLKAGNNLDSDDINSLLGDGGSNSFLSSIAPAAGAMITKWLMDPKKPASETATEAGTRESGGITDVVKNVPSSILKYAKEALGINTPAITGAEYSTWVGAGEPALTPGSYGSGLASSAALTASGSSSLAATGALSASEVAAAETGTGVAASLGSSWSSVLGPIGVILAPLMGYFGAKSGERKTKHAREDFFNSLNYEQQLAYAAHGDVNQRWLDVLQKYTPTESGEDITLRDFSRTPVPNWLQPFSRFQPKDEDINSLYEDVTGYNEATSQYETSKVLRKNSGAALNKLMNNPNNWKYSQDSFNSVEQALTNKRPAYLKGINKGLELFRSINYG